MPPVIQKKKTPGSRVKVAVRCRPAFQDEIDFAKDEGFFSIVKTYPDNPSKNQPGQISLTTVTGKQRDFYFDYVFGEDATQNLVYDRLARPIVTEVLQGCNGTIFAYGQTGTGKTFTMGILENVQNEQAGLIPRAAHQIFEYVTKCERENSADIIISLSFLQLYRETIQDLLSPGMSTSSSLDENLAIREDPIRGFYVEGLQEFSVRNYHEAEALINLGLQNRAIAPTLMNSTSSRSHTVLTINIEQRMNGGETGYSRTLRSKLLMVDLAGSERVRRTISKGTRLSEAKSINSSLSALGNVIAALAEHNTTHIPYRDSKLTRLLQDSLGGTAATSLIATIGPAAINYSETLSTLLFAQRCMSVKITPVKHEEIDYAEMCAKLQAELNAAEGRATERLLEQQELYEKNIRELNEMLENERMKNHQHEFNSELNKKTHLTDENFNEELQVILDEISKYHDGSIDSIEDSWLRKPLNWNLDPNDRKNLPQKQLIIVIAYCFKLFKTFSDKVYNLIELNRKRELTEKETLSSQFATMSELEKQRQSDIMNMFINDPRRKRLASEALSQGKNLSITEQLNINKIGSHLAPMSTLDAFTRVQNQYKSNNIPVSQWDNSNINPVTLEEEYLLPTIHQYSTIEEVAASITSLHSVIEQNLDSLNTILLRKDKHFKNVKMDLSAQMVERRKREEEVVNWSYILKYLLASASKLRKELNDEKRKTGTSQQQQLQMNIEHPEILAESTNSLPPPPPIPRVNMGTRSADFQNNTFNSKKKLDLDEDFQEDNFDQLDDIYSPNSAYDSDHSFSTLTKSVRTYTGSQFQPPVIPNPKLNHANLQKQPSIKTIQRSLTASSLGLASAGGTDPFAISPKNRPKSTTPIINVNTNQSTFIPPLPQSPIPQSKNINQSNSRKVPSGFAQRVVRNLGVSEDQASSVMSVIDRVSSITPSQLEQLDPETRNQIIQIRKELGISQLLEQDSDIMLNPESRQSRAEELHISRSRSTSAPRLRAASNLSITTEKSKAQTILSNNSSNLNRSASPEYLRRTRSVSPNQSIRKLNNSKNEIQYTNRNINIPNNPNKYYMSSYRDDNNFYYDDEDDDDYSQI